MMWGNDDVKSGRKEYYRSFNTEISNLFQRKSKRKMFNISKIGNLNIGLNTFVLLLKNVWEYYRKREWQSTCPSNGFAWIGSFSAHVIWSFRVFLILYEFMTSTALKKWNSLFIQTNNYGISCFFICFLQSLFMLRVQVIVSWLFLSKSRGFKDVPFDVSCVWKNRVSMSCKVVLYYNMSNCCEMKVILHYLWEKKK